MQSAVRIPTPEPQSSSYPQANTKRKRSSHSPSPSPTRHSNRARVSKVAPTSRPALQDVDANSTAEKPRILTQADKQELAKKEYERLLNARSGGTYIPPAKLRELQSQVTDKASKEYQRMAWEALKKSINGLINKVNISNIKLIVPELFSENLVRGRGLFVQSIMKAQASSTPFTPIYAAMAAIVNTKLPMVGELLMHRLVSRFRKAFKRNDKPACLSSTRFIAQLCNQQVVNELLAAQMLQLLLSNPTDDSVEIAVALMREIGQHLEEMNGRIANVVFDQFRTILHDSEDLSKKSQYAIEVLFQVRRDKYREHPAIRDELDLIEETDQVTHSCLLDEDTNTMDSLNIFKFDPAYEENEAAYLKVKAEILGEDNGDEEDGESDDDSDGSESDSESEKETEVKDLTNAQLTQLRKTIYLTISSSSTFEECAHKLMRLSIPPDQEMELPMMLLETCTQRPTYETFYGLVAERFARASRLWQTLFEDLFIKTYQEIHRRDTNPLRSAAQFFGHLLGGDNSPDAAIGWHVLSAIRMTEGETTSSSRIFIKVLFGSLVQQLGFNGLKKRLDENQLSKQGLFPTDTHRNMAFSINFFTSIGLGGLTEAMREEMKNRPALPVQPVAANDTDSDSPSSSSFSSRSSSRSRSRPRRSRNEKRRNRGNIRGRSYSSASRSVSPDTRRRPPSVDSPSRSPNVSKRRRRAYRDSDSSRSTSTRSPPPPTSSTQRQR